MSGAKKRKNTAEAEKKCQKLLTKIPKVTTFFSCSHKSITPGIIGDDDRVIDESADPIEAETSFIVDEIPPSTTKTFVSNVRSCETIKILSGTQLQLLTILGLNKHRRVNRGPYTEGPRRMNNCCKINLINKFLI